MATIRKRGDNVFEIRVSCGYEAVIIGLSK